MREMDTAFGLKTFYSKEALRNYVKELTEHYQREADKYGEWLGKLIRAPQQQEGSQKDKNAHKDQKVKGSNKPLSKGWSKMGQMFVNLSDPNVGMTEVLFDVFEEFKLKISKTTEALKSLESIESLGKQEGASYMLYLVDGVPSKLVIDTQNARPQQFIFSADFQVV
ncbi:MAG: hypothetical protein HYY67_03725 [Thaumarchaeota archaeon]|nr:hypothetical protein [Nitrososphaerota archaeon]